MRFLSVVLVSALLALSGVSGDPVDTPCSSTRFGCCSDGITPVDDMNPSNCPKIRLIGGCEGTQFGCCRDGSFANDFEKSNCEEASVEIYGNVLLVGVLGSNETDNNLESEEQTDRLILIALGAGLFSFVLFSLLLLLLSAVVIIVCRVVRQRRARKLRLILECDDETGVEMGSPLVAEEFGINMSL